MGNLGKVSIWANVGGEMPNMDFTKVDVVQDLPASDAYQSFQSRQNGDPAQIEFLENPTAGGFFVIPQRYPCQIGNYINGLPTSTDLSNPRVVWDVLPTEGGDNIKSIIGREPYLSSLITNKEQKILAPNSANYGSNAYPNWYSGPRWSIPRGAVSRVPTDLSAKAQDKEDTPDENTADSSSTAIIAQETVCPDIWWAIQTPSLSGNAPGTPFYLDVVLQKPLAVKQPTFFLLRIGDLAQSEGPSNQNIIDLLFIEGRPGMLYDRGMMSNQKNAEDRLEPTPANISLNGSVSWNGSPQRISIVPLAGRLCINVNGSDTLYTRTAIEPAEKEEDNKTDNTGTTTAGEKKPELTKGSLLFTPSNNLIRVIGSNSRAIISLGSIIFPERAKLHTSMPGGFNPDTNSANSELTGSQSGIALETQCSMVELPGGADGGKILGAYAKYCNGAMLSSNDEWGQVLEKDMHGEISLYLEDDKRGANADGKKSNKHYVIELISDYEGFGETDANKKFSTYPRLCPIWFRMRGMARINIETSEPSELITLDDDIIELSDSYTSPDRYHITHSLDIVLYNENGKYDALIEKSSPIQVGFSWGTGEAEGGGALEEEIITPTGEEEEEQNRTPIFTGVTLNGSKSLIPGKETISIHCEDYMFILEATQVINSPYYDGMDGYNVVRDLARKAHVTCIDDSGSEAGARYFLPSGYSFLEPVKHYDGKSSLKECMIDVCSSGAKVIYFDADGILHYDNIQGGIGLTDVSKIPIVAVYKSDLDDVDDKHVILDETRTEVKINSVVNNIFGMTIDRTDRTKIMINDKANAAEDVLSYRKVLFMQVPSLGSHKALTEYIERLKPRVFKVITGVSIKTADDTALIPMSFMMVNDKRYRIMGLNRSVRVDDNSITNTITGEWYGKQ